VVGALLRNEGELDPSAGQLTLDRRIVDLRTVAVVARLNLGGLASAGYGTAAVPGGY
jgi:hypothetical protein